MKPRECGWNPNESATSFWPLWGEELDGNVLHKCRGHWRLSIHSTRSTKTVLQPGEAEIGLCPHQWIEELPMSVSRQSLYCVSVKYDVQILTTWVTRECSHTGTPCKEQNIKVTQHEQARNYPMRMPENRRVELSWIWASRTKCKHWEEANP